MPKPWIEVTAIPGRHEVYRIVLPAGFCTVRVAGATGTAEAQCHQYRNWGRVATMGAPEARYRMLRIALHAAAETGTVSPGELRGAEILLTCAYAETMDPPFMPSESHAA